MRKIILFVILFVLSGAVCTAQGAHVKNSLRAPAYPLVTIDPYTSAWSMTDNLYDGPVRHWTDTEFPLVGVLRVDGVCYRFMGKETVEDTPIDPMAFEREWRGSYTFSPPGRGWERPGFDDKGWAQGMGAFGTPGTGNVGTAWTSDDVWVRRYVSIPVEYRGKSVFLKYVHDDIVEIYADGTELVRQRFMGGKEIRLPLPQELTDRVAGGKILLAAHCRNTGGEAYLDLGLYAEAASAPLFSTTAQQLSVDVQATRTHYLFGCGPVEMSLVFTAPLLPGDLEMISRPVNYVSYDVRSLDGKKHDVQIFFEAGPQWAIDRRGQQTLAEGYCRDGLLSLRTGSVSQKVLGRSGDNTRIDWGYFYMACARSGAQGAIGEQVVLRRAFAEKGALPQKLDAEKGASLFISQNLGKAKNASGMVMLAYDDIRSVRYFGVELRPWWNRRGDRTIDAVLRQAQKEYPRLIGECERFDDAMMEECARAGGQKYAELCALAYRQAVAAHKLVESPEGELLFLSKENNSNGSIGTVDISYPSAPLFLRYNPKLARGLLNHIFHYSESGRWSKPFPAHDVGTYPLADGQTYSLDMPVEEAGNMLILTALIAAVEGDASYARKHWPTLTVWADYLAANGLDPESQLCTDDFAGHLAHNANLSLKAITGVACYARLARMLSQPAVHERYDSLARDMASRWIAIAFDGDHYRLAFDRPGTWSQKYNLVWDKMLGLGLFPDSVARAEVACYLARQNRYGLPLDSRRAYTKADWTVWSAMLAGDRPTFEKFIDPLWLFMNETTDRVPMSDWYHTDKPAHVAFKARSVVGGFWIRALDGKL
ncbi:glutaminase [Bacteroidia bacterium]|nr:glutaminase [Bacteroidia bacterium]